MAERRENAAGLYMTIALLCIAVANTKGLRDPVAWILLAMSAGWGIKSLRTLIAKAQE